MTKNPSPLSSRPPTADGRPSDSDRARSSDLTGEEQGREPSSAAAAASAAAEASTGSSSGSAASSGQGDASAAETVQEDVGAVPVDAALEVEELDTDLYQSKVGEIVCGATFHAVIRDRSAIREGSALFQIAVSPTRLLCETRSQIGLCVLTAFSSVLLYTSDYGNQLEHEASSAVKSSVWLWLLPPRRCAPR